MKIFLIFIGLSSGLVIAGGVFAFIAIIGVVPRLAQKTRTKKYIAMYENSIIVGGIFGALSVVVPIRIVLPIILLILVGFFSGVFVGSMAVSIAEVLDVIPVLTRRISLKKGIPLFIFALAIGKLIGALIYFLIPGFAVYK